MILKWYAVYTKPHWEKKIAQILELKKVENYCPLQKVERKWSDRRKIMLEPLFKSYVFVHINEKGQLPVVQTEGVLSLVSFLGKPAVIRDEEIEIIRQFLNDYQYVQVEKMALHVNDAVKVIRGPLMEQEGTVLEVRSKTVKVLLPTLGFALVAEVHKENLEKYC